MTAELRWEWIAAAAAGNVNLVLDPLHVTFVETFDKSRSLPLKRIGLDMKRLDVAEAKEISATISAVDVHVGGRIAELRLSRSVSVSTLAEHLAVPPTVIADWESGRERVPASSLVVVVEYFSCHLDDIFDGLFDPAAVGDIVI